MISRQELEKRVAALPPLSDEQIDKGVDNIVRCLKAMDEKDGEAGLQRELDRIFGSESRVKDLGNGLVSETLPGGNGKIEMHVTRLKHPGSRG